MSSTKSHSVPAIVGAIAVTMGAWIPSGYAWETGTKTQYAPIESISYDLGSKQMSGYFVKRAATCLVTIMIIEKSDTEEPVTTSPTQVRLILNPGQIAGVDSEEGRSLNFTCAEAGTVLLVDAGDRETLVAAQAYSVPKAVAETR